MWESIGNDPCGDYDESRMNISVCVDDMDYSFSDKENVQPFTKNEELSMYDNTNPAPCQTCSPSHSSCGMPRTTLEYHDSNSQDSGYGVGCQGEKSATFLSPRAGSFGSSLGSMEDDFLDFSDVEPLEKQNLPRDFNKLIANPILHKGKGTPGKKTSPNEFIIRPVFRRALSLQNTGSDNTPNSSRVRTSLFKGSDEARSFKRPEPPSMGGEATITKRSKMFDGDDEEASVPVARPVLKRAFSATEESIMCAVQRSSTEPDLIGDFTKNYSLPLCPSRHPDLKAITPMTLSKLIKGEFDGNVTSFKVVDCRYPYEFDGGHIEGAVNIYTKEQCIELLNEHLGTAMHSQKNQILVFHCEFSSERGPNLYRYLRKEDRHRNESAYPSLFYPEIYLLEGGYKNFFENFSDMCKPMAYKEMLHPDHESDLRHFRQKSKTWNCDTRQRLQHSRSLKRLGK